MRRLAEIDRRKLAEMLGDRLYFEERSIGLYERVISDFAAQEPALRRIVPRLEQHRDQKHAHAEWLRAQLRRLEVSMPPAPRSHVAAHLATAFSSGPDEPGELLHALLACEREEAHEWTLLTLVAERAGDEAAQAELSPRRDEERGHVAWLERVLTEWTCNRVLGVPVTLPID